MDIAVCSVTCHAAVGTHIPYNITQFVICHPTDVTVNNVDIDRGDIEQQCSHCDSVEASYWSQSLENDAMVRADYALTTMIEVTILPLPQPELILDYMTPAELT